MLSISLEISTRKGSEGCEGGGNVATQHGPCVAVTFLLRDSPDGVLVCPRAYGNLR